MSAAHNTNCLKCNIIFKARTRAVKHGGGKFCSRQCHVDYIRAHRPKPNVKCAMCGKKFYKNASKKKKSKSGLFFCDNKCKFKSQSLTNGLKEVWPEHYGKGNGKWTYRNIAFSHYKKICNKCSYNKYPEILIVHHKDRNHSNSSLDNLEVLCPNCHQEEHFLSGDGLYHGNKRKRINRNIENKHLDGIEPTTANLENSNSTTELQEQ